MNAELDVLFHRLLGALCTGLYQGVGLTVLIWAGLRLLPRTNAATRHAVVFAGFLVVAVLPLVHFVSADWGTSEPAAEERSEVGEGALADVTDVDSEAVSATDTVEESVRVFLLSDGDSGQLDRLDVIEAAVLHGAVGSVEDGDDEDVGGRAVGAVADGKWEMANGNAEAGEVGADVFTDKAAWQWRISLPRWTAPVWVVIWVVIAVVRMAALVWQCRILRSLRRRSSEGAAELGGRFQALCREMGVTRAPGLLISREIGTPMVIGFVRPAVVIPAELARANEDRLGQILRHELAHVNRRDDWANLIQQAIRNLLFFHPGIWWLSRRLSIEREIACDDHVLSAVAATPRAYALLLTEFASGMRNRPWTAAPAGWNRNSQLKERIHMILDSKRNSSTRPARMSVCVLAGMSVLLAMAGLHMLPRVAVAQGETVLATSSDSASAENYNSNSDSVSESVSVRLDMPVAATARVPIIGAVAEASADVFVEEPVELVPAQTAPRAKPPVSFGYSHAVPAAPAALPALDAGVLAPAAPPPPGPLPGAAPYVRRTNTPNREESMERRLQRLERLVEQLLEQGGRRRAEPSVELFNNVPSKSAGEHARDLGVLREWGKASPRSEEWRTLSEQAKAEADRAAREAERAVLHAEKQQELAREQEIRAAMNTSIEREHLPMLEATRNSLVKQLEAIEKQIEEIHERQHEKLHLPDGSTKPKRRSGESKDALEPKEPKPSRR